MVRWMGLCSHQLHFQKPLGYWFGLKGLWIVGSASRLVQYTSLHAPGFK